MENLRVLLDDLKAQVESSPWAMSQQELTKRVGDTMDAVTPSDPSRGLKGLYAAARTPRRGRERASEGGREPGSIRESAEGAMCASAVDGQGLQCAPIPN